MERTYKLSPDFPYFVHPSFKKVAALADVLSMQETELLLLAGAAHRMYRPKTERKSDGGVRVIYAPWPRLKSIQAELNNLLNLIPVEEALYGRKGTSQVAAAKLHLKQPMIVSMDVRNFFPSISANLVQSSLLQNGVTGDVARVITKLTTTRRLLPQGAPTSPVLARIVVTPIVRRVRGVIEAISPDCIVSQYMDDLVFSGPVGIQRAIPTIRRLWREAGFAIHPDKTKTMSYCEQQEVLGVWLTDRLRPTPRFTADLEAACAELGENSPRVRGMRNWVRLIAQSNTAV